MRDPEPSLLQGFLWCVSDSEAIRAQTSQWKRNLLVFLSIICLAISGLPYLVDWTGYPSTGPQWLIPAFFLPLGAIGLYASKFGSDRFVESLLGVPKLDGET